MYIRVHTHSDTCMDMHIQQFTYTFMYIHILVYTVESFSQFRSPESRVAPVLGCPEPPHQVESQHKSEPAGMDVCLKDLHGALMLVRVRR